MKRIIVQLIMVGVICAFCARIGAAQQQEFKALVGPVTVISVSRRSPLSVPFIVWGGDMATFFTNGGLGTKPGTLFAQQDLDLQLETGDDFVQQVRNYMSGKTPFLRSTFRMIGKAAIKSGLIQRDDPAEYARFAPRGDSRLPLSSPTRCGTVPPNNEPVDVIFFENSGCLSIAKESDGKLSRIDESRSTAWESQSRWFPSLRT